jgi:hypothetical protein
MKKKNKPKLVNSDGKLGIEIGRLSLLPWKIRLLQSEQTRIWFLGIDSVGITKEKTK